MSEQKVRGIPHWGKFRAAATAVETDSGRWGSIFPHAKQMMGATALLIKKAPKFYVPQIGHVISEEDYRLAEEDHINLPYPVIALLSECWVHDLPTNNDTDTKKRRKEMKKLLTDEGVPFNTWKISVFMQREKNANIIGSSTVMDPDTHQWACVPVSVQIYKTPHPQGGFRYAGSFHGDPATTEILSHDFAKGKEQAILNDFDEDAGCLMALNKLLSIHDATTVKVSVPPKLAKKHAKKHQDTSDYSYHVLKIGGEVWDNPYVMGAGDKGGVRSHLRRGHIRRLEHKNVWVRSAYVHGSVEGFVEKDYQVGELKNNDT